jgi:hypothetical protein
MSYDSVVTPRGPVITQVPSFNEQKFYPSSRREYYGESGFPIPCNQGWGRRISQFLLSKDISLRENLIIDLDWPLFVRAEVFRFFQAMVAYFDAPNPVLSYAFLVNLVEREEEGIKILKKLKMRSILHSYGGEAVESDPDPEVDTIAASFKISDVGDIFNVRYFLFFSQEDPDDKKFFFEPLPAVSKELYDEFRSEVFSLLPDIPIEPIYEEEILLSVSGSAAAVDRSGKRSPNWLLKQRHNHFSSEPLFGHGTYIQKCPGDTRYSITLSVPHSNSVKLIEQQVAKVAEEVSFSNYQKDTDKYMRTYRKFAKTYSHFYCRDIKKDGLTKNRRLIQIVLEEIDRKYPGLPCMRYKSIYDSFSFRDTPTGIVYHPPRGIGLGMSSAITTIIQSTLFRLSLNRMIDDDWMGEHPLDALFYHDDSVFGSTDLDTLRHFIHFDEATLLDYGCIPNLSKSFISDFFVLCENYSEPSLDRKEAYQLTLMRQVFSCVNITHAKLTFLNLSRWVEEDHLYRYVKDLVNFFGHEFFPDEYMLPSLLGGWVPARFGNLELGLFSFEGPVTRLIQAASYASAPYMPSIFKDKRRYSPKEKYFSPINQLYPNIKTGNQDKSYLNNVSMAYMASRYTKFRKIGQKTKFFSAIYQERQSRFHLYRNQQLDFLQDWYKKLTDLHPSTDIYPPKDLLVFESVDHFKDVDEIYSPPNPYLSYLAYHNPGRFSDKLVPWPLPPSTRSGHSLRLSNWDRTKLESLFDMGPFWTIEQMRIPLVKPRMSHIVTDQWYDPYSVLSFTASYFRFEKIPRGHTRPDLVNFCKESELIYRLSHPSHYRILPYLISRLGYSRVKDVDLTYFEEEVNTLLEKRRLMEMVHYRNLVLEELDNRSYLASDPCLSVSSHPSFWTDTPLSDEDFFTWQTGKQNHRDWRNTFFIRMHVVVTEILQAKSVDLHGDVYKVDPRWKLSPIEAHLYIKSGGRLDEDDIPIIEIGAGPDFWEGSQGDNSDASSFLGMMVGMDEPG